MLVHVVGHACTMDTIPALADGCEHMPMRIRCMGACAAVMQCSIIGCQATCMMWMVCAVWFRLMRAGALSRLVVTLVGAGWNDCLLWGGGGGAHRVRPTHEL